MYDTAICLYVNYQGKDVETVRRWKDLEKSLGVSGTDSAFGSDMEWVVIPCVYVIVR